MWAYQAVLDAVGADMRRASRERFGELNADVAKWAAMAGDRPRARRAARHALRDAPGIAEPGADRPVAGAVGAAAVRARPPGPDAGPRSTPRGRRSPAPAGREASGA